MKKYLFAVQVFGLTAMVPITAFLELNHGTKNSFEAIPVLTEIAKAGKSGISLHNTINEKKVNEPVTLSLQTILLKSILN